MIIGFDASRAFVEDRTGTENYSYQLLKSLSQIDSENTYMVYMRSSTLPGDALRGWPKNFQFKIINFPRLWTQVGLAIQTFKDNLDILFVPAHTLPIIRKPGLRTVVTVHDLGSEYLPHTHRIKQRLYLSFMQKNQLQGATRIIAVSKATKKDLVEKIGIYPNSIKVVYEAYNDRLFIPIKGDILVNSLRGYGLKEGRYFLFVGTIQPRKNLERIIKAFSVIASEAKQSTSMEKIASSPAPGTVWDPRNDKVGMVIVGSKGWMSEEIYKLPKKLNIEERVKFLGYVADEDMPVLYSNAIALIFPSLFEGFGLPILEAQACGCPVLTSNISSMPEVAGKGAILVNPYNMEEIANAMIKVQENKIREKLIEEGFDNIKRFSWEKAARETLEVLKDTSMSS